MVTPDYSETRMSEPFHELPWPANPEGAPRRIGVEIEMAGVSLETMAETVKDEFGGHIESDSAFVFHVRDTDVGDFQLELDARVLKDRGYREHLARLGIELDDSDEAALERWLADAAGRLVPHEIVAPPIATADLPRLDRVRAALQQAGALGTERSFLYAFGLQINIEVHRTDAEWLLAILRSFLLMVEVLTAAGAIDLARRLSPYIRSFPGPFVRYVLDPDFRPDRAGLIDAYLAHNPTRNRPLDLLPLFAHLDSDRIDAAPVEHELIKPRPAFHYRLPNCEIDDPDWSLARPFNGWVEVERLAADPERLERLSREYLERPGQALGRWADDWSQRLRDWF
ncbi:MULTISPECIES: amidoligase family protein [unclassified Thioalkalivibrio]|uniref:amidoligase family protein n=1 Tax=unclassified Thioalkalivibrio TaxID=2621013 RepID=UPI00036E3D91|nr:MULTISPECIES: amidoligase family protein [unclassified Thioalkalivibrio]